MVPYQIPLAFPLVLSTFDWTDRTRGSQESCHGAGTKGDVGPCGLECYSVLSRLLRGQVHLQLLGFRDAPMGSCNLHFLFIC